MTDSTDHPSKDSSTTTTFETHRPLMFSIAYRMLGSVMEAEDMVQTAYLRYRTIDLESIRSPAAFLTTIITRLCINQLELARIKREDYIGPWLPEPLLTPDTSAPANEVEQAESISMAFLVLLERLSPLERAVFLLRSVFDYSYPEIAEILDKDESACRQLFSRANKHITDHRPRFKSSPEHHHAILTTFMQVVMTGDLNHLIQMLAADITLFTDGGGKVTAALHPIQGAASVAQFIMGSQRLLPEGAIFKTETINGQSAAVARVDGKPFIVIMLEADEQQIQAIRVIANPDKLSHLW